MAAPSVANATTLTFNASATEQHVTSTLWYETIVIVNNTNVPIFVATDGGTSTAGGASEMVVGVGLELVMGNEQQLPQANLTYAGAWNAGTTSFADGKMDTVPVTGVPKFPGMAYPAHTQSFAYNWSVQTGLVDANGTPTYVSIIPSTTTSASATNYVTVTLQ